MPDGPGIWREGREGRNHAARTTDGEFVHCQQFNCFEPSDAHCILQHSAKIPKAYYLEPTLRVVTSMLQYLLVKASDESLASSRLRTGDAPYSVAAKLSNTLVGNSGLSRFSYRIETDARQLHITTSTLSTSRHGDATLNRPYGVPWLYGEPPLARRSGTSTNTSASNFSSTGSSLQQLLVPMRCSFVSLPPKCHTSST